MNKSIEEYLSENNENNIIYLCEECGKEVTKKVYSLRKNPYLLCKRHLMIKLYGAPSNISRKESIEKKNKTFQEKYGGAPAKNKEVLQKMKNTCKEKYNVENPFASKEIQEKIKEKNKRNLGVEYPMQNKKCVEKAQQTNLEKYGEKYNFCEEDIHNKAVEKSISDESIKKRVENTDYEEIARKVSEKRKNETEEQKNHRIEESKKTNLERYGSEWYQQTEEFISESHKKYIYQNERFDSSWEVAYWIWCKDNKKDIKRNTKKYKLPSGRYIIPDFIVDGRLVEIKGDHLKKLSTWEENSEFYLRNDVRVLFYKDIKPILNYIYKKYGKNYLTQFKQKGYGDFKRKIIELDEHKEDIEKYKNKNIKIHYKCSKCDSDVFTSYRIALQFNDHLCKRCRKKK